MIINYINAQALLYNTHWVFNKAKSSLTIILFIQTCKVNVFFQQITKKKAAIFFLHHVL